MKSKKELLNSPQRRWNDTSGVYDDILLVPTGTKHDSGFMHIAVIGVTFPQNGEDGEDTYEICGYPDDITCLFPLRSIGHHQYAEVRMDCYYPQGILRYHGRGKFRVGPALSSIEISFEPAPEGQE